MRFFIVILSVFFLNSSVFGQDVKIIPSFEKLVMEGKTQIEMKEIFYGCIESIDYSDKDVFTGKNKLQWIYLRGAKQSGVYLNAVLGVEEFIDLSEDDPNAPKIGDCYAFTPQYFPVFKAGQAFAGGAIVVSGNFEVDNSVNAPSLKDKLTVTEFFEDRLDYGSKVIEITGKVFEISYDNRSFDIRLFSEKFIGDDKINSYYNSEKWINDDKIKKRLQLIKEGDTITLKGFFGGHTKMIPQYNGFEVLEIID